MKKVMMLVLCGVLIGSVQATPVVVNGDFESPDCFDVGYGALNDVPGWYTFGGASARIYNASSTPNYGPSTWTGQLVTFGGAEWSELKQDIADTASTGDVLTIDLDLSRQVATSAGSIYVILRQTSDDAVLAISSPIALPAADVFEHQTLDLTVGAGYSDVAYSLSFMVDGGSVYPWIDNVSIVPEPATMLLLGLGGLVLRRKR